MAVLPRQAICWRRPAAATTGSAPPHGPSEGKIKDMPLGTFVAVEFGDHQIIAIADDRAIYSLQNLGDDLGGAIMQRARQDDRDHVGFVDAQVAGRGVGRVAKLFGWSDTED